MKEKNFLDLPDKIFGIDSALMVIFVKPVGLILAAVILFNLIVVPRIEEIGEINEAIEAAEAKTKNFQQKINYLRSVDQEGLKRDEDLVASSLLPEKNSYFLVNVIKTIADKYGFRVDSFAVNIGELGETAPVTTGDKGFARIPVSMSLIGPADGYYNLAEGLEKSLPVLSISTFDMRNVGPVSMIDLDVDGYYISEKKLVESDKLSLSDLTLKQEETELLAKLSEFELLQNVNDISGRFDQQKEFVRYNRVDPFSQ